MNKLKKVLKGVACVGAVVAVVGAVAYVAKYLIDRDLNGDLFMDDLIDEEDDGEMWDEDTAETM